MTTTPWLRIFAVALLMLCWLLFACVAGFYVFFGDALTDPANPPDIIYRITSHQTIFRVVPPLLAVSAFFAFVAAYLSRSSRPGLLLGVAAGLLSGLLSAACFWLLAFFGEEYA
jgi:hypothetical protein